MSATALVLSRIGAHALALLIKELGLGQQAEGWTGDNSDQWLMVDLSEVRAIRHKKLVAVIKFTYKEDDELPNECNILIPDCYLLIRPQHIREFDPRAHGIQPQNKKNWMNDSPPDLDVTIPLPDIENTVPGLLLPRRYIPRQQLARKVKLKGSLGGGG